MPHHEAKNSNHAGRFPNSFICWLLSRNIVDDGKELQGVKNIPIVQVNEIAINCNNGL